MFRYVAAIGLLAYSMPIFAQDKQPISLMAIQIPGLFDPEIHGPYNQVYNRIIEGYDKALILRVAPLRRAVTAFARGGIDCYFFATDERAIYHSWGIPDENLLISKPVNKVALRIYSREGDAAIAKQQDARGKYIAVDQGAIDIARAANDLSIPVNYFLPAQTLEKAFNLLNQKRVDAIIAFDSDVNFYRKRSGDTQQYSVSKTFDLGASWDSVICKRTSATEDFMSHVNQRLENMRVTGQLSAILSSEDGN